MIIVIKYMTIKQIWKTAKIENFRIIDYIGNDNEECVWFCKKLKCNIFYQSTITNFQWNECRFKTTMPNKLAFYEPSNVIEAMFKSNNPEYYDILVEWYCDIFGNKDKLLNFDKYMEQEWKLRNVSRSYIVDQCVNDQLWEIIASLDPNLEKRNLKYLAIRYCQVSNLQRLKRIIVRYGNHIRRSSETMYKMWQALNLKNEQKPNKTTINIAVLMLENSIYPHGTRLYSFDKLYQDCWEINFRFSLMKALYHHWIDQGLFKKFFC